MKIKALLVTACSLVLNFGVQALTSDQQMSIKSSLEKFDEDWNNDTAEKYAELYTENGDFVNIFGMHFSGNQTIAQRHIEILQSFLKDSKIQTTGYSLKEISPNVVAVYATWTLNGYRNPGSDNTKPGEVRSGIFTHIYVCDSSKCLISTSQNTMFLK